VSWKYVTIEKAGRIAVVRFDRGDGVNAMSTGLINELTQAARSFEGDLETSAVIVTGTGKVFSMGYDLREPVPENLGLGEQRHRNQMGPKLCKAW